MVLLGRSPNLAVWLLLGVLVVGIMAVFDAPVARLASHASRITIHVFGAITQLGTSTYLLVSLALIGVACWAAARYGRNGRRIDAGFRAVAERVFYIFTVLCASGAATQIVKHVVGRARPRLLDQFGPYHFSPFNLDARFASFPSGHTTTAFATAVAIGLVWPRGRILLLAIAALVAVSRVVLGAHYPSDVAAGLLLGVLSAALVARLFCARRIAFRPTSVGGVARGARAIRLLPAYFRRRAGLRVPGS